MSSPAVAAVDAASAAGVQADRASTAAAAAANISFLMLFILLCRFVAQCWFRVLQTFAGFPALITLAPVDGVPRQGGKNSRCRSVPRSLGITPPQSTSG